MKQYCISVPDHLVGIVEQIKKETRRSRSGVFTLALEKLAVTMELSDTIEGIYVSPLTKFQPQSATEPERKAG